MLMKIAAGFFSVLALSTDVRASLIVVCGPPAPDRLECCPVVLNIYRQYRANPRSRSDRLDKARLAAWYNGACVTSGRKRL
jgi:hypothetical protein